jgi:hypothetical protein
MERYKTVRALLVGSLILNLLAIGDLSNDQLDVIRQRVPRADALLDIAQHERPSLSDLSGRFSHAAGDLDLIAARPHILTPGDREQVVTARAIIQEVLDRLK